MTTKANKCSPDVLFGAVSNCFKQFANCHQSLWEEREEVERNKRQTLVRTIFAKKSRGKNLIIIIKL